MAFNSITVAYLNNVKSNVKMLKMIYGENNWKKCDEKLCDAYTDILAITVARQCMKLLHI